MGSPTAPRVPIDRDGSTHPHAQPHQGAPQRAHVHVLEHDDVNAHLKPRENDGETQRFGLRAPFT